MPERKTHIAISSQLIENEIYTIRGTQVMLDYHLAVLYGVETKRLNEQVKRNIERFPSAFMFRLQKDEWDYLQSQIATTNTTAILRSQTATTKRRTLPYVFTEQGVTMLSAVLNTETAIQASIQIIRAFVKMRQFLAQNAGIFQRLDQVELKQLQSDEKFDRVFKTLEAYKPKPEKGIFFEGQIFDAYIFVADLIKSAEKEIVLIDNYVDESVLLLLTKRKKGVQAVIYTKKINPALNLDLEKHNAQYPAIELKELKESHDRFLLIDGKRLFHIGASLKDLGKKWFAFSKMEQQSLLVLNKLNELKE